MSYESLLLENHQGVAWIWLNRPNDLNSISAQMLDELEGALQQLIQDDEIRVLVLSAKGRAFCAGADLKGVLKGLNVGATGKDFLDRCDDVFGLLRSFPKPVIAALNGITMAGGLELAMCCDLVLAAESAMIGDAHSNFGVFPGAGGAAVLPRKIGLNRAKYLLYTGDSLSAREMEAFGLVNQVVADDELEAEVQYLADRLAEKSPLVLRRMKEVANAALDQSESGALRQEMLHLRQHFRSYDFQEGLKAFSEKRKPEFKGC
tara:strand:+ start:14056 stop:14841 length:786 start_codon:yes stop_codon:yes gene_type:complete